MANPHDKGFVTPADENGGGTHSPSPVFMVNERSYEPLYFDNVGNYIVAIMTT